LTNTPNNIDTHVVGIALGSNIGDRLKSLQAAIAALAPYVFITAKSQVYETAAAYVTDQPAFLNAAVLGETKLEPLALLLTLKHIEVALGRTPTFRYGPRVIDLDILFYGEKIISTPELVIPHSQMAERAFVLRPLSDIKPSWKHPKTGLTVVAMLGKLSDADSITQHNVVL